MKPRVLSVQQFSDTAYRMRRIETALKKQEEELDVIFLDSSVRTEGASSHISLGLAEYLRRYAPWVGMVIFDSPQSFLVGMNYVRHFCGPAMHVVLNLRGGPTIEFCASDLRRRRILTRELRLHVSAILLNGPAEKEIAISLKVRQHDLWEISTPYSELTEVKAVNLKAISLAGDFHNPETHNRAKQLIELIRPGLEKTEYKLFAEGKGAFKISIEDLPKNTIPGMRIFVSEPKEYDNFGVLSSLKLGIPLIASDNAVFGLGLTHGKEYLTGNHPQTIKRYLEELLNSPGLAAALIKNGREFIQKNHSQTEFESRMKVLSSDTFRNPFLEIPLLDPVRSYFHRHLQFSLE